MEKNINKAKLAWSKRAQQFLANPIQRLAECPEKLSLKKWCWDFTLENLQRGNFQSDSILTLFYFSESPSALEALFLESLSRMCIKRNILSLLKLSFRELENYLRDENHLPSLENLDALSTEACFKQVKNSLLLAIIMKEIKKNYTNDSDSRTWSQLNLLEKNQNGHAFILRLNKLFSLEKPMELAFAGNEEFSVVMYDFPLEISLIQELADGTFGGPVGISSFKVVAVQ